MTVVAAFDELQDFFTQRNQDDRMRRTRMNENEHINAVECVHSRREWIYRYRQQGKIGRSRHLEGGGETRFRVLWLQMAFDNIPFLCLRKTLISRSYFSVSFSIRQNGIKEKVNIRIWIDSKTRRFKFK